MMYPTTTRTPEFLGLSKDAGMWAKSSYGKGIIIGVIDSGIDWRHPSFDDAGIPPPPARWKGACTGWVRGVRGNNKLIGVRSFVDYNPADETGHGTHVASIAAGNFVSPMPRRPTDRPLGRPPGSLPAHTWPCTRPADLAGASVRTWFMRLTRR